MRLGKAKWFLVVGTVFLISGLCASVYAAPAKEKVVKMKYDCYIINTAPTAALDTWLWDYVEKIQIDASRLIDFILLHCTK